MSLRLAGAGHEGLDDETTAKIDRWPSSDLPERQKAALRLADAYVAAPRPAPAGLERHFTPEQVVELVLDVLGWSKQKILVALDRHAPVDPDGLTFLRFDDEGRSVIGGAVPS
jgi:hypothetical protein